VTTRDLDLITIGRSSVDLYGTQIGGRLEDMRSFEKYVGGSPTNMAVGTARLGLRSALLTKVGDEHMGRFIREALVAEGVDVSGVLTDPQRLTALVLLGIRDDDDFPLIFYRENCADMALSEDDVDPGFIGRAGTVVATGTHLSHPRTESAVRKAIRLARDGGARTALDIDYRPNLWGLSGHGDGASRYVASAAVTERLQTHLAMFDLIVGTEEEFHIAGGTTDTLEALRRVRDRTDATLVCKRGASGATAFTGAIPESFGQAVDVPGFPVEVFNVLGAGDGFMSGLLCGWIRGEDWRTALTWANACGAFAVSRHGCAPAYPTTAELRSFLASGVRVAALRKDRDLEQMHWSETRPPVPDTLRVLAFDHRTRFQELPGATPGSVGRFKRLCLQACTDAAERGAASGTGYGILCDDHDGRAALRAASGTALWIGRPADVPESHPLRLDGDLGLDLGGLAEWPRRHVVSVRCRCRPGEPDDVRAEETGALQRLFEASRRNRLELLVEIAVEPEERAKASATADAISRLYSAGIHPDWWTLESMRSAEDWRTVTGTIETHDARTRGILVQARGADEDSLAQALRLAARHDLVRGFIVGRAIYEEVAARWFEGACTDDDAVAEMSAAFRRLCDLWNGARPDAPASGRLLEAPGA
jgi:5-dehydro-2-deoxygluconokinase